MSSARDHLIVALDFPSATQALGLVERLEGQCQWFKIGLELFLAEGPQIVTQLRGLGFNVFLDLKLHDIPNTVASAIRSISRLDIGLLTVHAAGGPEMLRAAQDAAAATPNLQLLAVTVLTSMDARQLLACGIKGEVADQVSRLGRMAIECQIPGLVGSAEESSRLRHELGDSIRLIVPGIRPSVKLAGNKPDDQRRIATPAEAIARGASMLVVGRPITQAPSPSAATASILAEIESSLAERSLL